MKETVERILDEEYDFGKEVKPLSFSCDVIRCEMQAGREQYGAFYILGDSQAEGRIYVSDLRFECDADSFEGSSTEIPYKVSSYGLKPGDKRTGFISIISNRGEYELPFEITVQSEMPMSSMGEIRNLFHFANLAKEEWNEAVSLFYSHSFVNILEDTDAQFMTAYRALSAYRGSEQNMEQFLQVARKKTAPSYSVDVDKVETDLPEADELREIVLRMSGWGYVSVKVMAEGDFLTVDTDRLTAADLVDGELKVGYTIEREMLHRGKNEGRLFFSWEGGYIEIPVIVNAYRSKPDESDRRLAVKLTELYMEYRTGRVSRADFCRQCTPLISDGLKDDPEREDLRLYQLHVLILEKRNEEAGRLIETMSFMMEREDILPEIRAYFLYLKSLYATDPILEEALSDEVKNLFKRNSDNWRLAWICLFMRDEYRESERKRDELIREQFDMGCRSPLLLLEGVHILIKDPKRMNELGDYELTLMRFALRWNITTSAVRERFAFLCDDVHIFNDQLFAMLTECYDLGASREILTSIVTHLMRGNCIGTQFFKWYSAAVEEEIRMARLYEYYMMSADRSEDIRLPRIVLMYFAYRSGLDTPTSAYLYANVCRHKDEYDDVYEQFEPAIKEFAEEQLKNRALDENLAYLYGKLLKPYEMGDEFAAAYTELLFTERFIVTRPDTESVVLVYDHLKEEFIYPLFMGEALIPVFGSNVTVWLEDSEGCRYVAEGFIERKKILNARFKPEYLDKVEIPELGCVLYSSELGDDQVKIAAENESLLSWLSAQDVVTPDYSRRIMLGLAEYYFDSDIIAPLDALMERFEPVNLTPQEREICLRIMVARGMYDEAFSWVCGCGTEGIDYKILLRLCDRLLVHNDYAYDQKLLDLCSWIIREGKYDEETLDYLLRYANGTLRELKDLWRAADSFGMNVQGLMGKMILQILYTGMDMKEKNDIFLQYIKGTTDTSLEKAFITRLSFDYMFRKDDVDTAVFERVAYLYRNSEELTHFAILAFLKYASLQEQADRLDAQLKDAALYFIGRMWDEGIFLPCFLEFGKYEPRFKVLSGQRFIEYMGKPESHVVLHYAASKEGSRDEYRKEEMQHVYGGIYIKAFIIFYGEKINYYITEENGRQEKLTQASVLEATETDRDMPGSRFSMINNIAISRALNDEKTFNKALADYEKMCAITDRLFVPYGQGQ
ncbi:MAG: DUF5717 family protein [Lachnospiraceae bacterium]|nr:DUF5717 family protein [Lachnospiraceae bacterium]